MEIWKDVEGYEGMYQVSSYGRVKSLAREVTDMFGTKMLEEKIVERSDNCQYYMIALSKNNVKEHTSIHRLVAKTFIPNPENKPCVNHIDGNKHNNRVENLEWVTYSENSQHAIRTGLLKPQKHKRQIDKLSPEEVIEDGKTVIKYKLYPRIAKYDSSLNLVAIYETRKDAMVDNCLHSLHVGVAKLQGGYYYVEEGDLLNTRQWDRVRGKRVVV